MDAFLFNTLRGPDKESSRQRAHVVEIRTKIVCGAGQIDRLASFEVIPVAEASRQCSPSVFHEVSTLSFNLKDSPSLLKQQSKTHPMAAIFSSAFVDYNAGLYYADCKVLEVDPNRTPVPIRISGGSVAANVFQDICREGVFSSLMAPGLCFEYFLWMPKR